jgi:phosphoribosyl-ATP pyrophosphohydrolase
MIDRDAASILPQLMAVIRGRKDHPPPRSYTASLVAGGVDQIGAKVLEEAHEVVAAARGTGEPGRQHLIHEVADLIYHVLVLLASRDANWQEVEAELFRRFGVSGLDEKAARGSESRP